MRVKRASVKVWKSGISWMARLVYNKTNNNATDCTPEVSGKHFVEFLAKDFAHHPVQQQGMIYSTDF
ncbi:hypothetical protein Y032_0063g3416 [Ancylostoma ceylanicum]|uniref:Uncharacterized protein n=1 Tax=Ancylostoma ceylanicum TaxID=53326 RepID=A0A016U1L8_9BILA|nr:hypothetical protein Y032_0063g3416 [Ancylostoma ceylanicum]